ncbi:MAG: ComF family protein [Parachlamydiaceae bacterium]|nr:ComF family protein [Parachlamydiaceae bacterium]
MFQQSLFHLLYPNQCLHCRVLLPSDFKVLCDSCSVLLELIDSTLRCPTCFNELHEEHAFTCQECIQHPSPFYRIGSVFDYEGPASTLVKRLKYGNQPYLAKGMGSLFVAQWHNLNWPLPDMIVPVPLSMTHWLERGYNQSELLAQEIGKIFNRPVSKVLTRKLGDYSQAALSMELRKTLEKTTFVLKKGSQLEGKTILLIDDVLTSGSTLRRCGEVLIEGNCGLLYGMTFCRTNL